MCTWRNLATLISHRNLNVTIPSSVLNNGSLHAHVFLGPSGKSPTTQSEQSFMASTTVPLTKYLVPSAATFNLFTGEYEVCDTWPQADSLSVYLYSCLFMDGKDLVEVDTL